MELAQILTELWRKKLWILLAVPFALFAALSTAYDVSPGLPPKLEPKGIELGAGQVQMMLDTAKSPLAAVDGDLGPLNARAVIYSSLMRTEPVRREISEASGIPYEEIAVQGVAPPTGRGAGANKATGPAANRIVSEQGGYLILSQTERAGQEYFLPLITVYTQAPTAEGAIKLADGTVKGFTKYLDELQDRGNVEPDNRVTVRPLGEATGGLVSPGIKRATIGMTFAGCMLLACFLILAIGHVRRGLREIRTREAFAYSPEQFATMVNSAQGPGSRPDNGRDAAYAMNGHSTGNGQTVVNGHALLQQEQPVPETSDSRDDTEDRPDDRPGAWPRS